MANDDKHPLPRKDRRELILELRAASWSYARIGAELGISRQRVWTMVNEPRARREVRALAQKHEPVRRLP